MKRSGVVVDIVEVDRWEDRFLGLTGKSRNLIK